MKHIFFSILTVLAFCHCQPAAPKTKNTLYCYVRYDATGKKIKAEAGLFDAISKVALDIPRGMRFQSTEMKALPVRGITYSLEFPAAYIQNPVFERKNAQGVSERYPVQVPLIDSFFFETKVISVQVPSFMEWVGKPLEKNETLVFMWENAEKGRTIPMEVSSTLGKPLIEIPAAKLAQIGPGNWSLYLVRKRRERTETLDLVVEKSTEYYTKPIEIRLVK